MPPLICASPVILDQSFPRSDYELQIVKDALGEIQYLLEKDFAHVIVTNELREIVESYDWTENKTFEIYRLLDQWFLQKHSRLIEIDVSEIRDYSPHPIPKGCNEKGLTILWADEVGKILVIHDRCCTSGQFFVGIICEKACAGDSLGEYENDCGLRTFPLVGPEDINKLDDAYDSKWQLPRGSVKRKIKITDIQRNYKAIGAESIEKPKGDSHAKVKFKDGREWTLDLNIDPVSEDHLPGLAAVSGYPLNVIKYALVNGELPRRILRSKIMQYVIG